MIFRRSHDRGDEHVDFDLTRQQHGMADVSVPEGVDVQPHVQHVDVPEPLRSVIESIAFELTQRALAVVEKRLNEVRQEISALRGWARTVEERLGKLEDKVRALETMTQPEERYVEAAVRAVTSAIADRFSNLEGIYKDFTVRISEAVSSALRKFDTELSARLSELRGDIESLKSELRRFEQALRDVDALASVVSELKHSIESTMRNIEDVRRKLEDTVNNVGKLQDEVREILEEFDTRVRSLETQMSDIKSTVARVEQQCTNIMNMVSQLSRILRQ